MAAVIGRRIKGVQSVQAFDIGTMMQTMMQGMFGGGGLMGQMMQALFGGGGQGSTRAVEIQQTVIINFDLEPAQ